MAVRVALHLETAYPSLLNDENKRSIKGLVTLLVVFSEPIWPGKAPVALYPIWPYRFTLDKGLSTLRFPATLERAGIALHGNPAQRDDSSLDCRLVPSRPWPPTV